jgi:hypothetical protein
MGCRLQPAREFGFEQMRSIAEWRITSTLPT